MEPIMDDRRLLFKIISELTQYPDEGFMRRLPGVESAASELPEVARESIQAFIRGMQSESLIRLQECYTAAFYLDPRTTLNMTYHHWGNSEKRAGVLSRLERVYRETGYERIGGELPDFLPLMLEFLSLNPETWSMDVFRQSLSLPEAFRAQLRSSAPQYAGLLESLACVLSSVEGENHGSGP